MAHIGANGDLARSLLVLAPRRHCGLIHDDLDMCMSLRNIPWSQSIQQSGLSERMLNMLNMYRRSDHHRTHTFSRSERNGLIRHTKCDDVQNKFLLLTTPASNSINRVRTSSVRIHSVFVSRWVGIESEKKKEAAVKWLVTSDHVPSW